MGRSLRGWIGVVASALVLAAGLVLALALVAWPETGPARGLLMALGGVHVAGAIALLLELRRRARPWHRGGDAPEEASAEELIEAQRRVLEEQERRIELRELRLARLLRLHQQLEEEGVLDLVEQQPPEAELAALVEADRRLMALIDRESQRAFERIRANRYAGEDGVDTALIMADAQAFVLDVARLYRPEAEEPLLETDIELLAKATSSAALHLLVVIDGLPVDLKSYSIAKLYRLLRRGTAYYGTYKAVRPYLEHGLNALHAARLAFSTQPVSAGGLWLAGKLTSHGARALGEHVMEHQAVRLLHDFIRVLGFEAAMVYGGQFRHRDANWVFGSELVNLEVARGDDRAGREAAIATLARLALRHEFDRVHLLRRLAAGRPVPVPKNRPRVVMTRGERRAVASRLLEHCRATKASLDARSLRRWRQRAEETLGVPLAPGPDGVRRPDRARNPAERLLRRLRRTGGGRRSRD